MWGTPGTALSVGARREMRSSVVISRPSGARTGHPRFLRVARLRPETRMKPAARRMSWDPTHVAMKPRHGWGIRVFSPVVKYGDSDSASQNDDGEALGLAVDEDLVVR